MPYFLFSLTILYHLWEKRYFVLTSKTLICNIIKYIDIEIDLQKKDKKRGLHTFAMHDWKRTFYIEFLHRIVYMLMHITREFVCYQKVILRELLNAFTLYFNIIWSHKIKFTVYEKMLFVNEYINRSFTYEILYQ